MTEIHDFPAGKPVQIANPKNHLGLLLIVLSVIGMFIFFWPGLVGLTEAWAQPEYSHGYLIPIIAIGLFLREYKADTNTSAVRNQWPGFVLILIGLFFGLLGNMVHITDITNYGVIIVVGGFILMLMGLPRGFKYWVPVAYLIFMLPLPQFIYLTLSIKLQMISSEIGVFIVALFGIPVYLEGNIIDLGIYKLQVAEACSGLRYLFPLTSFGFLFAVLYRGPVWHKVIIFLSAAPVTVLMNSIRIGIIGILVDQYGIEQAEGFLHAFQGWVIFIACIAVLYLEAMLLQQFTKNPQPFHSVLDVDLNGLTGPLRQALNIQPSRALITSAIVVLLAGIVWVSIPAKAAREIARENLALFPRTIASWEGKPQLLEDNIKAILQADDYLMSNYTSTANEPAVNLFIAFYNSQTETGGIHSPEVCIPAGGWEISAIVPQEITLADKDGSTFSVNRAIIQKGTSRQLVYYWFEQRGRRFTSGYTTKIYTVWDTLVDNRSDGALVRVITPLNRGEKEEEADKRLNKFLSTGFPELHRFIPE